MWSGKIIRMVLTVLWCLALAIYVAAKIDFLRQYDPSGVGTYVSEHRIYWLAMAGVLFAIWFLTKLFPRDRQ